MTSCHRLLWVAPRHLGVGAWAPVGASRHPLEDASELATRRLAGACASLRGRDATGTPLEHQRRRPGSIR
jgi:hypothetical protein